MRGTETGRLKADYDSCLLQVQSFLATHYYLLIQNYRQTWPPLAGRRFLPARNRSEPL